jgi:apolipoprotein N-acyltransferase
LSVIGGLLSGLAWTGWCTGLILLIAFVPFFLIENHLFERADRYSANAFFIYILPGFLIFGMIALGWMKIASLTGVIFIILGLSFIMAFTMWLAHVVRLRAGNLAGLIAMITFWLAYEFISLNVNLISPWINLGNGLAKDILFIQWYEFTGTAGGTLWILLSNLSLSYLLINTQIEKRHNIIIFLIWIAIVTVPPIISVARYFTIKQNNISAGEVLIIQPNIDPYTEKFNFPFEDQLSRVLNLAGTAITDNTSWVITPETTVDDPVNLDDLDNDRYIQMIKELTKEYPGVSVVSGFVSYKIYPPSPDPPTISARITDRSGLYSDHFNSALKIDTGKNIEVYHKSKLVPGIEMQFSNGPGRLIAEILPYLGGTKWGYGTQEERECFEHNILKYNVAPIICYESVFGSFVTDYVRNGARVLFIITNDGWWKNTNGYKQHLAYASVRSIETRRQVVRTANTGVSCIIDIKGKVIEKTEWWTQTVLVGEIYPETIETIYVKYGDYLMRIASTTAVFIILIVFIAIPVKNKRKGLII